MLVLNKCYDTCPKAAAPHWTTNVYGVCGVIWGLHSAVMQQLTFWSNRANKEKESNKAYQDLLLQIEDLQNRLTKKKE